MAANGHTNCVSLPTLKQPLALPMVVYAFLAKHSLASRWVLYTHMRLRGDPKRYGHQWLENNLLCIPMLEVALTTVVGGYGIFGVKVDFQ